MLVKEICRRIKYGVRYSSESYISYLKKKGIQIGDRTQIFDPRSTIIDETRPWMLKIGMDVQITAGVTILTHGYDWAVLKGKFGEVLGSSGAVDIGNNVFIGMHTIILKGVHIGNNVIIGAGSLVNRDIPDNCVAAGNPCRVIMSLEEYYEKRKKAQIKEVSELVKLYRRQQGKEPDALALHEFFWLFTDNPNILPQEWKNVNRLVGNEKFTNEVMKNHKKKFESYESFLKSVK